MPKKSKKTLIIVLIIVVLVVIMGILVYLYLTTDAFKSNESLFVKYMGKAFQNIETLKDDTKGDDYNAMLENNKYLSSTELLANYTANAGTSNESTSNLVNNLKIDITGQTDKSVGFMYANMSLLKNNENIVQMEALKTDNKYGLRFSDLIKQYLVVENSNLIETFGKMNINYTLDTIPEVDTLNIAKFSDQDIKQINNTYTNALVKDYSKNKFSKAEKVSVTVNDKEYIANAYSLNMTIQELNDSYINLLEQLKQDDTILSKVDEVQQIVDVLGLNSGVDDFIKQNNTTTNTSQEETQTNTTNNTTIQDQETSNATVSNTEGTNTVVENTVANTTEENTSGMQQTNSKGLKEKLISYIDTVIRKIKNKNIGTDEAKITVYESSGKSVRITIETQDYKMNIDSVVDGSKTFFKVNNEIYGTVDNAQTLTINKNEDEIDLNLITVKAKITKNLKINSTRQISGNKKDTIITLDYTNGTNKIVVKLTDNKEIVNMFDDTPVFDNSNSVVLNNLTQEQIKNVLVTVNDKLVEKRKAVDYDSMYNDFMNMLKGVDVIPDTVEIKPLPNLTNSEISKFNSQFELYKGENLSYDSVNEFLKIAKDNLDTIEVISNNEIKLNISNGVTNEELANKVSKIISADQNKYKTYSVKLEYDQATGIIKDAVINLKDN